MRITKYQRRLLALLAQKPMRASDLLVVARSQRFTVALQGVKVSLTALRRKGLAEDVPGRGRAWTEWGTLRATPQGEKVAERHKAREERQRSSEARAM